MNIGGRLFKWPEAIKTVAKRYPSMSALLVTGKTLKEIPEDPA